MTNKRFLATFTVGTIFGASLLLSITGHDIDQLYLKVASCFEERQQLEEDRKHLQEQLSHATRGRRLHKVNVEVLKAPDEFIKIQVKKRVKDQLRPLMNKELTLLEQQPELFKRLLEDRTFHISNEPITIRIQTTIVGETSTLYITADKEQTTLQHSAEKDINDPN